MISINFEIAIVHPSRVSFFKAKAVQQYPAVENSYGKLIAISCFRCILGVELAVSINDTFITVQRKERAAARVLRGSRERCSSLESYGVGRSIFQNALSLHFCEDDIVTSVNCENKSLLLVSLDSTRPLSGLKSCGINVFR